MERKQSGVMVTKVAPLSSAKGVLKPGDVILEVDGNVVSNEGRVKVNGTWMDFEYLLTRKYVGESINSQLSASKDNKKKLSLLDVIDPIARNNQCDLTTAKQKLIVLHTQKFNTQVLRLSDEHLRKQREEKVEGKSLIAKTICLDLYHQ